MLETLVAWLLFPLGGLLGWSLAQRRGRRGAGAADTLAGLGSLARDDDDQAIAALSRAAEAEPETVELQSALGGLFRKRGEIDRAIRMHESLLARPDLPLPMVEATRFELAQDFLKAGLIDRAEPLLESLASHGAWSVRALESLIELYEQGRDWPQATAVALRLQSAQGRSMGPRIAQHHCELADNARLAGQLDEAQREVQRALDADHACVRAHFLLAAVAEARGDWSAAIRARSRAIEQDPRFLAEAIGPIEKAFREAGDEAGYRQFLEDAEAQFQGSGVIGRARAQLLAANDGGQAAASSHLAAQFTRQPSAQTLLAWMKSSVATAGEGQGAAVTEALAKRLAARPRYRCRSCGLEPSVLFWQCPSCRQWGSITPADDYL